MVRLCTLLVALLCASLPGRAQGVRVLVENRSALPRTGELVEVPWMELLRLSPSLNSSAVSAEDPAKKSLPVQAIDVDQDGVPELLLVRADVPAGGSTTFTVLASAGRSPVTPVTDARFVLPREDLAWENDRIAFRMYGPALAKEVGNGVDVWTKRVRTLVVQKWYEAAENAPPGHDPYHEDHGEGADFFSVGRTLGAGGCALLSGDSLLAPGVFAGHRIIATGPLRAQFELTYMPVQAGGRQVTQRMTIAIDAGTNLNRMDILFEAEGERMQLPFAAGIVKRKGISSYADSGNCIGSLWGLTTDRQEEGFLGTGIVMTQSTFRGIRETPVHLLLTGTATTGETATYYAGAGWTRSGDFTSEKEWLHALRQWSARVRAPLKVTVAKLQ